MHDNGLECNYAGVVVNGSNNSKIVENASIEDVWSINQNQSILFAKATCFLNLIWFILSLLRFHSLDDANFTKTPTGEGICGEN